MARPLERVQIRSPFCIKPATVAYTYSDFEEHLNPTSRKRPETDQLEGPGADQMKLSWNLTSYGNLRAHPREET
jgi:hypothetical protein